MNEEKVKAIARIINNYGKFKKLIEIDNWEPSAVKGSIKHLKQKDEMKEISNDSKNN